MHLTVRRYRKVEGDKQQIMEGTNRLLPLLSKIDGFVEFYCCFTDDGALLSVSVYRDAKGTEEATRTAAKWVEQNLAKHLPEKPEVMSGQVYAHQAERQKAA